MENTITLDEFFELKEQLKALVEHHEKQAGRLDANWIAVIAPKDHICANDTFSEKDGHHGWIFFDCSTNSNGTDLAHKIHRIVAQYGFTTKERQN